MVRLPKYLGQALRKRFGKKTGSRYEKQFEQNRQYHRWRHSREAPDVLQAHGYCERFM
jgi:hypothetical protein